MKVFMLAAGLGTRMRPLTNDLPKPLIPINGKPLIVHSLEKLRDAGFSEFVINCHWHADKLQNELGNGEQLGITIQWSYEPDLLNTAGGLLHAEKLIGEQPFLLHNSDIWCDYPFEQLRQLDKKNKSHLILVPNPEHNPNGDFGVIDGMLALKSSQLESYTYSGISVLTIDSIKQYPKCRAVFPLVEVWNYHLENTSSISAEIYCGNWSDIGTIERWKHLEFSLL